MFVGFVWNIFFIVLFWVSIMLYCFSVCGNVRLSMFFILWFSNFVWFSLLRILIILLVWWIFFIWYFWVFGVILYSCGILWESLLILFMVKLIFVFCVVVSRWSMVLVDLFIVIFSVMVFLNVVLLVILCGSVFLLFCL